MFFISFTYRLREVVYFLLKDISDVSVFEMQVVVWLEMGTSVHLCCNYVKYMLKLYGNSVAVLKKVQKCIIYTSNTFCFFFSLCSFWGVTVTFGFLETFLFPVL